MDDSARPKFDSLTVEELKKYVDILGQEIVDAFDAFHFLTDITVTRALFIAEAHDELTGFAYKANYGFSFDYEPVPDA